MLKYSRHNILKTSIISKWSIGSKSSILKVFLEIFKYILQLFWKCKKSK